MHGLWSCSSAHSSVPAIGIASRCFGAYRIPSVDALTIAAGLSTAYFFMTRALPRPRLATRALMLAPAVPLLTLAALVHAPVMTFFSENRAQLMTFGPFGLGFAAGALVGPLCGLWLAWSLHCLRRDANPQAVVTTNR